MKLLPVSLLTLCFLNLHPTADASPLEYPNATALVKRIATPQNTHSSSDDEFVHTFCTSTTDYNVENPDNDPQRNRLITLSSSVFQLFSRSSFGYCDPNVTDETVVVVVSQTAVYMAVILDEDFAPEDTSNGPVPDTTLDNFSAWASTFFTNGLPDMAVSLSNQKEHFQKPETQAFIMTPWNPNINPNEIDPADETNIQYPGQIGRLKTALGDQGGVPQSNIVVKGYQIREGDQLPTIGTITAFGKILYLYDPHVPIQQVLWIEQNEQQGLPLPVRTW